MRIPSDVTPIVKILLWIMFAISVVAMVICLLVIGGVRIAVLQLMPGQAIVLLFATSIAAVFSLLMANVHYKITDTHLRLNLMCFDILGGRIRLENILNIVMKDGKMYISYIWQGSDPVIAQIAIAKRHYNKMKDALMRANPQIVFFDENETSDSQQQ